MVPEHYFQALVDRINSFYIVSQPLLNALRSLLRVYHFPNAEYILRKGRRARFAWFIVDGYVREVNNNIGKDNTHTTWFWYPGDLVLAYPVFLNQKDAVSDIEVLPNTTLLEISHEDFIYLKTKFPELGMLIEEIKYYYHKGRLDHNEDLFILSGKQKYRKLHQAHPKLFNVAKHKDIATFLGLKDIGFRRYYSLFP